MHRFIPGLAKLLEKRKITQTEKRQRDCVCDRSKRNREKGLGPMHGLLMTTKILRCFALPLRVVLLVGVDKIPPVRLESGEIMHS